MEAKCSWRNNPAGQLGGIQPEEIVQGHRIRQAKSAGFGPSQGREVGATAQRVSDV
jgi:hypothetical protein